MMNSMARCGAPFTAAQWQELEHQALIFKYLMAGVPVPQELLLPIRRSFEALPARYYHHPALGYCSYYGKKIDPEPGRCRRTDGKKWRCAKDAYPDSKYCERHMNRGRNRSRKPVESQTAAQTQSSSSTVTSLTSLTPAAGSVANTSGGRSFPGIPSQSVAGHGNYQSSNVGGSSSTHLPINLGPFANRYCSGFKTDVNEHSFFSETSGSARSMGVDLLMDNSGNIMPSRVSSFQLSKPRDSSLLHSSYPELQSVPDLGQVTVSSYSRQPQHSFFGGEFTSPEPMKNESQPLRPFFDEWPNARDSWSDLDERSNHNSFSTTQLSISIPMASSDFSTTSSLSANGDD